MVSNNSSKFLNTGYSPDPVENIEAVHPALAKMPEFEPDINYGERYRPDCDNRVTPRWHNECG